MPSQRIFSDKNATKKKLDYHGTCRYARSKPDMAAANIDTVNFEVPFEEAMKLSLALQAALLDLNKYKRSAADGKRMGLLLSIKTKLNAISVIEQLIRVEKD